MMRWRPIQGTKQHIVERYHGALRLSGAVVVLCGCVYVLGCTSPPAPAPEPSKEDIQNDANRFFEKMEREKQGKPDPQP